MDISFYCDKCGQHIAIDEAGVGTVVNCPKCDASLLVPGRIKETTEEPPPTQAGTSGPHEKKCPFCAELILADAIKCKHCGEFLNRPQEKPAPKPLPVPYKRPVKTGIASVVTAVTCLIILSVVAVFGFRQWKQREADERARREFLDSPYYLGEDSVRCCDEIAERWAKEGVFTKAEVYKKASETKQAWYKSAEVFGGFPYPDLKADYFCGDLDSGCSHEVYIRYGKKIAPRYEVALPKIHTDPTSP